MKSEILNRLKGPCKYQDACGDGLAKNGRRINKQLHVPMSCLHLISRTYWIDSMHSKDVKKVERLVRTITQIALGLVPSGTPYKVSINGNRDEKI